MTTVQPAPRPRSRPLPHQGRTLENEGDPTGRPPRSPADAAPSVGSLPPRADQPGPRIQRLRQRRRLVREELAVVAILVIALVATLVILGFQWLSSGTSTGAAVACPCGAASHFIGGPL